MPWLLLALALIGLVLYWELILAEGAHLGPRVVVWLYDLTARRYDRIKQFDWETESTLISLPLIEALIEVEQPRVLDVGAGTGRVARALLRHIAFDGDVISLDLSEPMLRQGQRECAAWPERALSVRAPADGLPFANEAFDAVTCLEVLEFLPAARRALHEYLRVLKPGGLLLLSNRIGWPARLIPGKTFSRPAFQCLLAEYPLECVHIGPWQVEYDLAWAKKGQC